MVYDWNSKGAGSGQQSSSSTYDWSGQATYVPTSPAKNKAPRRGRAIRPTTDEDVELYLRQFRAGVVRDELRAYQGMRDRGEVSMSDRQITESANKIADDVMASKGLPSGEELQEWRSQREAASDLEGGTWVDRSGTRIVNTIAKGQASLADFATGPIQAIAGGDGDYFKGTAKSARELLDFQADAASAGSSGIMEELSTMPGYIADPNFALPFAGVKKLLQAANAARGVNAARAGRVALTDEVIAGVPADIAASGFRTGGDVDEMRLEVGMGAGGAVAFDVAARGIGAAWKKAFPGKPLPRSRSEAEQALDAYDPEWRNKPLDPESPMGQLQAATKDLQDEVDNVRIIESEKQAAKYDPGERIDIAVESNQARGARKKIEDLKAKLSKSSDPAEQAQIQEDIKVEQSVIQSESVPYRAKKGIDRFNDRQAARDEKLQEGLDAPHIAKDKAKRGVVDRLEAENQGGKVLDFEAEQARINDEARAEALKDPETFDLVNDLQENHGMTRAEAEAVAIPELDTPTPRVEDAPNVSADAPDLGTPKEPWQMSKSEFIRDTETTPKGNKTDSPSPNKYKDGDLVIDGYGDDPYVYQLQRVDPEELSFSLEGEELSRVVNMPTTQQYIQWYKQGIDPPPVDVVIKDGGARHSTNRRRVVAAREAGVKDIPAFVEIGRHKSMVKQALSEGKPVPPEVLKDYPDLTPTRPVEGASGGIIGANDTRPNRQLEAADQAKDNLPTGRRDAGEALQDTTVPERQASEFVAQDGGAGLAGGVRAADSELAQAKIIEIPRLSSSGELKAEGFSRKSVASSEESARRIADDLSRKLDPAENEVGVQGVEVWVRNRSDWEAAQLQRMSFNDLRAAAKQQGLPSGGTKKDLVGRLKAKLDEQRAARSAATPPPTALRSGIAPDDIAMMVKDAIAAGKWTAKQAIIGARWALEVGGDAIKTMRDFAGVMLDKFGRGIRKHIPEMWQKFKAMRQRVAATRERTRLARQKGGIDLRSSKQSPDQTRNFAKDSIIARVKRRVSKETFDQLVDPIADRLYKASPRIYNRMYRFMTEANIAKHELRSVMDPIMHDPLIKKLPEYNQNEIKSALLNADPKNLDDVLGKISPESASKVREMVENARFILNDLFDEAKAVGMEPGYLENFWPRLIKPGKTKLLREKLSGGQKSEFDDALKEVALNKYGGDVSKIPENEVASVMSRVLSGYGPRPLDSSLPKPLKQRSVSKIPDEYLQYYESFDKSLDAYIERMTNEIAKRRLLGGNKSLDLDNAEVLADSVAKLIRDEGITGAKADDVASMIQSVIRGSEAPVGSVTRVMRDTGYILTMGQFKSAIRQLGDFSVSANQYGVANTLKGAYRTVLGKNRVSLLDIGLDRIAEEFSGARSSRAVDLTFKATGLDLLDRKIIKNTVLEAALLKAQKQAQRNPEALKKQLAKEFGEDADKLVEALAKGDTSSDELAVYLTSRLGDVQPVTRLEVPQGYLDGRAQSGFKGLRGWPVLAYQLKTFTLRRLGLIRRQGIHEIAEGLRMMKAGEDGGVQRVLKGSRTLIGMVAMFTAADASVDQLINWVYGEDDTLGESAADAALSLVGTNRYGVDQSRRSGSAGATTMFMPASLSTLYQALVTDPARIVDGKSPKTIDRIPIFGPVIGPIVKEFIESGDSGGNSPAPPKPPSPPSPPRP